MNRTIFGEVDAAVGKALANRPSKLDVLDVEDWTPQLLREDADAVNDTIEMVCVEYGWTLDAYSRTYRRLRPTRHTPRTASY